MNAGMNLNLHINLPLFFFGVAYAAFFVWLVVRIINRREKWAIKLALYSGIAFVILAFVTPFAIILFLDMVGRRRPTTEEFFLLFIPFAILVFLLERVIYRYVKPPAPPRGTPSESN